MANDGYVYIMTNKNRTVLYVGVTNDLKRRIFEHRNHLIKGSFSGKYNLEYLVYYEYFEDIVDAIAREKQLKAGSRKKKEERIESINKYWKDLYGEVMEW